MIVGIEPSLYFGFVVENFPSYFVVGVEVVVTEVLECSAVEGEALSEFLVVDGRLAVEG